MAISNYLFSPASENCLRQFASLVSRLFSIQFVFAKLVALTIRLILCQMLYFVIIDH